MPAQRKLSIQNKYPYTIYRNIIMSTQLTPIQTVCIEAQKRMLMIDEDKKRVARELGFAAQALSSNEKLMQCSKESIINAVVNISRTSLTLNPIFKLAYLVPRDGQAILDPSYMGLVKILRDSGAVKNINAYCIYEDEQFEFDPLNDIFVYKPIHAKTEQEHKARVFVGAVSVAILPNGIRDFCFMPAWEINKVKESSKASKSSYSPWNTWEDEMRKKTVLKRHFKTLVSDFQDDRVSTVLELEEQNNGLVLPNAQNKKPASLEHRLMNEVPTSDTQATGELFKLDTNEATQGVAE